MNHNSKSGATDRTLESQEQSFQSTTAIDFGNLKQFFRGTLITDKEQNEAVNVVVRVLEIFNYIQGDQNNQYSTVKPFRPQIILNVLKFLFEINAINKAPYCCRQRCTPTRTHFFKFFNKDYSEQSYQDAIKLKRMLYTDYNREYFIMFSEFMMEWNVFKKNRKI